MTNETPDVFAPAELGPITLRNRTVKAAAHEGPTGIHGGARRVLSTEAAWGACA